MKTDHILFRLVLVGSLLFLLFLPPFSHNALADDDSDSAADSGDNDSGMDSDHDDDKQADKNDDDSGGGDMDDDRERPHPRKYIADAPVPATHKPAAVPVPSMDGNWWHPQPGTKWGIQYIGKINTNIKIDAFDLDLFDTDEATIREFHEHGAKVICYFSAGSYEGWRPDVKKFPASVLGRALTGWKYERWLDIRKLDILKPIMEDRIKLAKQKNCDAIDPDNVEGYDNKSGFGLSPGDQIAFNKMLSSLGHSMGLAVGLKNDLDQVEELLPYFDFQVNEQCFEYHSCHDLLPFIRAGKPVFNVEYNVAAEKFCPQANAMNFDSLKKDLDLGAKVKACR